MASSIFAAFIAAQVWLTSDPPIEATEPLRAPCRAQYVPLTPYELVGMDECGNIWKLILPSSQRPSSSNANDPAIATMGQNDTDEAICVFWDLDTGEYMRLDCPEPGQITGSRELQGEGPR